MKITSRLFWMCIITTFVLMILFILLLVTSAPVGRSELLFKTLFLEAVKVDDVVIVEVGVSDNFIFSFIIILMSSFVLTFIVDLGKVVRNLWIKFLKVFSSFQK